MYQVKNILRKISGKLKLTTGKRRYSSKEDIFNQNDLKKNSECDWEDAKPFSEMPGPSKWLFPLEFLPTGKLHNATVMEIKRYFRDFYGSIARFPGFLGRPDVVFTFEPEHFEKVYRTEGVWPIRLNLDSFIYYRKHVRPDIFKGMGGLVTEQGKPWADLRFKVNPILLKPQIIGHNLPQINEIAFEFLERISKIRDPITHEMPGNFLEEVNRWTLESICVIALNTRLNLIGNQDSKAAVLVHAIKDFFQLAYVVDVLPSLSKYFRTPSFNKLIKTYDTITNVTTSCINEAVEKCSDTNKIENSVFGKLLKIDKQAAIVMAIDMLMAGIDTTSSAFIGVLYQMAKNPDKQNKLREEILKILPDKDSPLTQENMKNMPYLRACIKETLRMTPIVAGNLRFIGQNLVLGGYQVPKGTAVTVNSLILHNDDKYFPKSQHFLPERWLRNISSSDNCPSAKATHPFLFLPFGFGSRMCIGRRIAEMEIEVLTSRILRNYHLSWHYPDIKYHNNTIITPTGELKFKFEKL